MGLGTSAPSSKLDVRGTVQVGVDDTGHDVRFYGATSGRYMEWDESEDALRFQDNVIAKFGTGKDFQIYHSGTDSIIDNYVGDIVFNQRADDKDIIFKSDDGSGGATEYFRLDGSSKLNVFSQNARVEDNIAFQSGGGKDVRRKNKENNGNEDNDNGD